MKKNDRKNAIEFLSFDNGIDYRCLEEEVIHHPNDIDWLLYSCILYEQSKFEKKITEHMEFWEKEKASGAELKAIKRMRDERNFSAWPDYIMIECTTACPAKCTNCTHESLIQSGKRRVGAISYEEACYRIKKVKLYTLLFGVENPKFGPVGLGEPFCHPQMLDILEYATLFFDHVELTTNAFLLSKEKAEKLATLPLKMVSISLSYFDKEIYEREIGMDYDAVVQNIVCYFEQRKKYSSSGIAYLHIFDNSLSTQEDYIQFKAFFEKYTREGDVLTHRPYYELIQNHIKTNQKEITLKPCAELWHIMTVDLDGNIYPCCMGLWREYDEELALGKLEAPVEDIIDNLMGLRYTQLQGSFDRGGCDKCPTVRHYTEFQYPAWMYHQAHSVRGVVALNSIGKTYETSCEILEKTYEILKKAHLRGQGWATLQWKRAKRVWEMLT